MDRKGGNNNTQDVALSCYKGLINLPGNGEEKIKLKLMPFKINFSIYLLIKFRISIAALNQ